MEKRAEQADGLKEGGNWGVNQYNYRSKRREEENEGIVNLKQLARKITEKKNSGARVSMWKAGKEVTEREWRQEYLFPVMDWQEGEGREKEWKI